MSMLTNNVKWMCDKNDTHLQSTHAQFHRWKLFDQTWAAHQNWAVLKSPLKSFTCGLNAETNQPNHLKRSAKPRNRMAFGSETILVRRASIEPPSKPGIEMVENHVSRIKKAAEAIDGDCPLLTCIYPGFDCGSIGGDHVALSPKVAPSEAQLAHQASAVLGFMTQIRSIRLCK